MRKALLTILLVGACVSYMAAQAPIRYMPLISDPRGENLPRQNHTGVFTVNLGNGINYHNGPVMPGTPNVYLIWYGNWKNGPLPSDSQTTVDLVTNFLRHVGGSPYEMINSTYGDTVNDVTSLVHVAGSVKAPTYPMGKNLSGLLITRILGKALQKLPSDSNGIYFVLTTSDVNQLPGFCISYCGWHSVTNINGADIKYSFVGNSDHCNGGCAAQVISPNNDSGADGMINVIAHELEESISDPDLNAWWDDVSGGENADKCVWTFGDLLGGTIGNGGYNETINGVNYLIQMNWENARGGGCDNFLGGPFHTN